MDEKDYKAISEIIKDTLKDNNTDKPFCSKESYDDVKEYIKIVVERLADYFEKESFPPALCPVCGENIQIGGNDEYNCPRGHNLNMFNREQFLKGCGVH